MINYCENRAIESVNPILKARYSGLVWDFKKIITNTPPSHEICRLNIKAIIDLAYGEFHMSTSSVFYKLKRALVLSIKLNDNTLISNVKDAIINLEKKHKNDNSPVSWRFSFDLSIENNRVKLSKNEESEIINYLETKLNEFTHPSSLEKKADPWSAQECSDRLASYYKKQGKIDEVKRVVLEVGKAYGKVLQYNVSSLQKSAWLESLYEFYLKYHMTEEANSTLIAIRKNGPEVASELKKIHHPFGIKQSMIDEYLFVMCSGNFEQILYQLILLETPSIEEIKERIKTSKSDTPLLSEAFSKKY
jgi:hypothetical protein